MASGGSPSRWFNRAEALTRRCCRSVPNSVPSPSTARHCTYSPLAAPGTLHRGASAPLRATVHRAMIADGHGPLMSNETAAFGNRLRRRLTGVSGPHNS
jgi:hypothetical protein